MENKQGTIAGLISCAVILAIAVFVLMSGGSIIGTPQGALWHPTPYKQYVPQLRQRLH